MSKKLLLILAFFSCFILEAQIERVEPPHWWTGLKDSNLQLLVYGPDIAGTQVEIKYPGILIKKVNKAKSPNYLFIDLIIQPGTKPGILPLVFKRKNKVVESYKYKLKKRLKTSDKFNGFDSSDAIYLITPDRFANANPGNDIEADLLENTIDRKDNYARHGGDIQGITEHVDYISNMGFTAIWSSPLLINDMPQGSYHGYAITDYYRVDPRFGTLEEYKELAQKASEKGIKLIMDQIANHCGLQHWWMKDLPFSDWVNYQEHYESNINNWNWESTNFSNHRRTVNQDIYASERDKKEMTDGWFVDAMPDLNQRNPFMAKYIIQNSIWWIETLGLGGIRQDTYPYPDKDFMSKWAGAIMREYPNFSIVGEEWSYNPLLIAYWQEGNNNKDGYDSNLTSTMDFAMQERISEGILEEEKWDKGLVKIYEGLANDFVYASPKDIMIFPDNHDMSRIFTQQKGDVANTKMALATLLCLPRIAQLYYGTEILMDDFDKPGDHGLIRTDFPGGWENDSINAFTGDGLSKEQKDMQHFLKTVLNYRKSSKAIHQGKTIHFAPFMGTYFLFRVIENEVVVLILNKNDQPITIDLKRYDEMGLRGKTLKNIVTGTVFNWGESIDFSEKGVILLSTKID